MPTLKAEEFFTNWGRIPDVPFGSLWWIEEDIWREKLGRGYNSNRKNHPGLSISRDRQMLTCDPYSVLHGSSSRRSRDIEVRDISERRGMESTSYFGHLRPVPIGIEHFNEGRISRSSKPFVDDEEKSALEELIRERGWSTQ